MKTIVGEKTPAMVSRAGRRSRRSAGQPAGRRRYLRQIVWVLLGLTLLAPGAFGDKKKKKNADQPKKTPVVDYSNIVWPNPPAIARIRYQSFYAAQKISQVDTPSTKKQKWMDRKSTRL